ncbi:Vacuolar protein sorting-associated protein 51 [Penicillium paradoxum]|uniref:Vacuolar protein sorting-associated protein 51 n=1 Tax=Penicillium paradoxum TaxID=176176 RepID=UPI002546C0F0|nr:Vacuolar protein sorting-associated protein 51 [Penicillium paradoxum]KAJ5793816.1 Vacuolar protein sorting-associated protein 51 [Penicillium paradoxum]
MADLDVASHYNLPSEFPEEWPAALDVAEESEEEPVQRIDSRPRKSRYMALERSPSDWRSNCGSRRGKEGRDNAREDEPDPLGTSDSVLRILKQRGVPLEEEGKSRYLLSSTSFSPALFLSQAHHSASIESLMGGLDNLSHSIDQKSASLKVLVEANFERFVRAKATIDSVYTEMRNQGVDKEAPLSPRRSGHFRSYSGQQRGISPTPVVAPKKTALVKESEYGMKGIRGPLVEASVKAEEVWGPALGGREREKVLKSLVETMEKHRDVYEIGSHLSKSIQQRDYDAVFEQYTKARALANRAKNIAQQVSSSSRRQLNDSETHTILAMGRMWMDVDQQIHNFKRDLWRRLADAPTTSTTTTASGPVEEHMELIGALLELGVEDNPIWKWLQSRYEFLKTKIMGFCDRCKGEIEILRRRLAGGERPTPQATASYLRLAPRDGAAEVPGRLDTDQVIELWECVEAFLTRLLSSQSGLLGEVLDFWEVAQSFIDGNRQRLLPVGFEGESRKHHRLSTDNIKELERGVSELVNLIRENVVTLFAEPPTNDVSLLFSPVPPSPSTPESRGVTPTESRFKLDPRNLPFPAPKLGEHWEEFSFWPPFSNSLSGVHYLSKFLIIVGTAASEMAALRPIGGAGKTYDLLKALVSVARERSARVACAAWSKDAEICKMLEDWTRDSEKRDLTKMPGFFVAFEGAILGGMQKILYISEAMAKPGAVDVVTQPPAKLLQMVRTQFVSSVYKALSGLVENAERLTTADEENEWIISRPAMRSQATDAALSVFSADSVDSWNRNVRILLTLSNLKALQADHVPQLISNFETSFSVKLTEEAKTIRDVLSQIEDRLFQSYVNPTTASLNKTITTGIASPDWEPSVDRPEQVRPYVYNAMLTMVLVHTEISTTIPSTVSSVASRAASNAPSSLLATVLTYLLSQISSSLLTAFAARTSFSLPALMQATLDTEFIAQTLNLYLTDEASNAQSQIYVELDRRTTNDARIRLQAELGEMRVVLKRLRDRTKGEFACFRKQKSGGGGNSGGSVTSSNS